MEELKNMHVCAELTLEDSSAVWSILPLLSGGETPSTSKSFELLYFKKIDSVFILLSTFVFVVKMYKKIFKM